MVTVGDDAPEFAAPLVGDDIEPTTLSDRLDDAPVVLAFFPAAFTGTCTTELCTFRDRLAEFESVGGTVLGVSTDLPFALAEFREQESLDFGLVSDATGEIVADYGVDDAFEDIGLNEVAQRSVFVVDDDGVVTYRWLADDPGQEPDYDAVAAAVEDAA